MSYLPDHPKTEAVRLMKDPDHLRRKAAYLREVAAHPYTHPDRAAKNTERANQLEAQADLCEPASKGQGRNA